MLRIIICHNYYQQRGGEDVVVEAEVELLRSKGHQVELVTVHNNTLKNVFSKFGALLTFHHSPYYKTLLCKKIKQFKPDLVHIHNTFPLLTPSILDACNDLSIPVICTLHNYRLITPSAIFSWTDSVDSIALGKSAFSHIVKRSYRDSYIATAIVAWLIEFHKKKQTWHNKVDRFICLSQSSKAIFCHAGFRSDKISVKPNFSPQPLIDGLFSPADKQLKYLLFVGRLSKEKGLETLLSAARLIYAPLKIIGGESRIFKAENDNPKVTFLGELTRSGVQKKLRGASALIVPSECYETFGMVAIEAFSLGIPVICSKLGALADIVQDGYTGLHFKPANPGDLAEKINYLLSNDKLLNKMSINARREYLTKYTPEVNYHQLITIYNQTINDTASVDNQ